MSPFSVCRISCVHLLIFANLLLGFMLLRSFSSLAEQDKKDDHPAWYPSSEIAAYSAGGRKQQKMQGQGRGGALISQSERAAPAMLSKEEGAHEGMSRLCEFKRDLIQGLPRQVLVQKLVECYKEMIISSSRVSKFDTNDMIIMDNHKMSRRLLKEITDKYGEENRVLSQIMPVNHGAPFHLDYSGPQTHPPKNN